jgi:FkbM family methyltransferase
MHLRSATMLSQQQQTGVLETMEPPSPAFTAIKQHGEKLWLNHGKIHRQAGSTVNIVGPGRLARRAILAVGMIPVGTLRRMTKLDTAIFGALAPGRLDRIILALTKPLPDNWIGLRLAMLLRRAVTMRLNYPDGALDVERWGMRMRLHPRDNGCEKNLLFTPRMYEPMELSELETDIARAGDQGQPFVFIDVGANVGLFSLFIAARAGPGARILAIEPEPGNLRRLGFNIAANPGVPIKVVPKALSDEAGHVAVELDRRDRGGTRTKKITQAEATSDTILVTSQTLLDVVSVEGVDAIDALKIDIEGLEDVVLHPFFRDVPPRMWPRLVIIEDQRASWKRDLISIMVAKGYSFITRSTHKNLILRRE